MGLVEMAGVVLRRKGRRFKDGGVRREIEIFGFGTERRGEEARIKRRLKILLDQVGERERENIWVCRAEELTFKG